jgi:hypothetical protein
MKEHPYMPVLKVPLMADLQQKVGELALSISSCPTIINLQNTFKLVHINKKFWEQLVHLLYLHKSFILST